MAEQEWEAELRFDTSKKPHPNYILKSIDDLDAWCKREGKEGVGTDYEFFLTHGIELKVSNEGFDMIIKFKTEAMKSHFLLKWS